MSRSLAACSALLLIAAANEPPLPHASGAPAGPGPGCGGGFTAARGDTLYSIARRCETSVVELVQENRLGQPPVLAAGQRLGIPGFDGAEAPKPPEAAPPPPPPARRPPPPSRPAPPPPPRAQANIYRFQTGDTLYSLARWARTSLPALLAANPGIDPRDIDAGDPVTLPRGATRPEPMRLRERGRAGPLPAAAPMPPPPPRAALPPRPPAARPAAPPDEDESDKPKPDDEDGDTPGGMDDGAPQPDGM
jgi:LysM repeat protein